MLVTLGQSESRSSQSSASHRSNKYPAGLSFPFLLPLASQTNYKCSLSDGDESSMEETDVFHTSGHPKEIRMADLAILRHQILRLLDHINDIEAHLY
jgi:hypothetical protein